MTRRFLHCEYILSSVARCNFLVSAGAKSRVILNVVRARSWRPMGLTGSPQKTSSPAQTSWWDSLQSNKRGMRKSQPKPITPRESEARHLGGLLEPESPRPTPVKQVKAPRNPPLAPAAHVFAHHAHGSAFQRRSASLLKVPALIDSPVNSPNLKRQRLRTLSNDDGPRANKEPTSDTRSLLDDTILGPSALEAQAQGLRINTHASNTESELEVVAHLFFWREHVFRGSRTHGA